MRPLRATPDGVKRRLTLALALAGSLVFGVRLACATTAPGPLRVLASNPRYFTDGTGQAIYLSGAHTWANLQDIGLSHPPPAFDFTSGTLRQVLRPRITGDWWQVATDPDLGELTTAKQQPVDFGLWQAVDGTWQLWSCIRNTKEPGVTRLFYHWEGHRLTDSDWQPLGIALHADAKFGENPGGLQAPFVFRDGERFVMFYGSWDAICSAAGSDAKHFERQLNSEGKVTLFEEISANPRDPMVIRIRNVWHCYYTAHPQNKGAVNCRTSADLREWSKACIVARGGAAGDGPSSAECPFVVELQPGHFYLFRTQQYGSKAQTSVYFSHDPLDFGKDNDQGHLLCTLPVAAPEILRHDGQWFIAALLPSLKGIQVSHLGWEQ